MPLNCKSRPKFHIIIWFEHTFQQSFESVYPFMYDPHVFIFTYDGYKFISVYAVPTCYITSRVLLRVHRKYIWRFNTHIIENIM